MGFDFSSEERRQLGYRLIDRIDQYFASLDNRAVQPSASERSLVRAPLPLPELGADAGRVLDDLCREMTDKGFHIPTANYFGLMNPTPTYMAVLAEALVAALNPQLASVARSQFASTLEAETLGWVASRFGWHKAVGAEPAPAGFAACDGTFTSGGNEANFTGLALAISHKFPNAIEDGIATIGARPVFYASSESHHSLEKSAGLLGLGRIGALVANRAVAFGMSVLAYDPFLNEAQIRERNAEPAGFDAVLQGADYLSLHLPLTRETRGLVGARQFEMMKAGALSEGMTKRMHRATSGEPLPGHYRLGQAPVGLWE